jgi:hypothetical protein
MAGTPFLPILPSSLAIASSTLASLAIFRVFSSFLTLMVRLVPASYLVIAPLCSPAITPKATKKNCSSSYKHTTKHNEILPLNKQSPTLEHSQGW